MVYFHTHPLFAESSEIRDVVGGELVTRIAPPSSDDFRMMVSRQKEKLPFQTEERIVSPMGIWTYGLKAGVSVVSKEEEMYKLGTLFMSLSSISNDIDRRLQMLKLHKIQPGWGEVADAYDRLMAGPDITTNQDDRERILAAAKAFEIAMDRIGYIVRFELYP